MIEGKSARKIMTEDSKPTEHIAFRLSSQQTQVKALANYESEN